VRSGVVLDTAELDEASDEEWGRRERRKEITGVCRSCDFLFGFCASTPGTAIFLGPRATLIY
jgi:hypothetical protein